MFQNIDVLDCMLSRALQRYAGLPSVAVMSTLEM